jgi:hypothetical protein
MSGNVFGGNLQLGKNSVSLGMWGFFASGGDCEMAMYSWTSPDKAFYHRVGTGHANTAFNTLISGTESTELNFAEFKYTFPGDKARFGGYVVQQDGLAGLKDLRLVSLNGVYKLPNGMGISLECAKNYAEDDAYHGKSGYILSLSNSYSGAAMSPTNAAVVNKARVGDHGWNLSYRHLPSGVGGKYNRIMTSSWTPLATDRSGNYQNNIDNVNALRFSYQFVPWKNTVVEAAFDHIKPIDGTWTNNSFQLGIQFQL